jgi:hypothetical protein
MRASWPERMTAHQLRRSNQPAEGHTRRAAFRPNARVRGRSLRCPVYVDSRRRSNVSNAQIAAIPNDDVKGSNRTQTAASPLAFCGQIAFDG